jgi:Fe(3+) dicitrate transport protein
MVPRKRHVRSLVHVALFALCPALALAEEAPPPAPPAPSEPATATDVAPPATGTPPPAPTTPPPPSEEVSVVGTRVSKTAGSAHVVKQKQLEQFEYDDPHAVLLGVPGVYVRGEDAVGLRPNIGIRGATSDRSKKVTLMEDGVLFAPAPYSAPAAYYFPLVTRMKSVRVVKGPASISYGPQTVGGAIDMITQDIPAQRKGTLDVGAGQYGYKKLHLTYGSSDENSGFLIDGVHLESNGFKQLDGGGDTGFHRNELMVKGSYLLPFAGNQEIGIKLGYSDEASNETYLGLSDADFRANALRRYRASGLDRMEWKRTQVALTHRASLTPNIDITTTAYRHDLDRAWRKVNGFRGTDIESVLASPTTARNAIYHGVLTGAVDATTDDETILIGPNHRVFISQGLQTLVRVRGTTGPVTHRAEYGIRLHYDEVNRRHTQDGFVMTAGALLPDGRATEVTVDETASTHALAVHAVDAVGIGRLTVTPGIRLELFQSKLANRLNGRTGGGAHQIVLPGVGAHYAVTDELGVLAGVHRGFSPPPPSDDNRKTKPEDSVNYEAGTRWASKSLRAEVIGFYNDYRNLTDICTFSNGCENAFLDRQSSAGRARIYGLETYAEAELRVTKELSVPARLAYTYTRAIFLSDFDSPDPLFGSVRAGDDLPYVPKHQASGSLGLETKVWALSLAGTYVAAMRERAGQGETAPADLTDAYFILDASGSYRVLRWLSLYGNARNLLDNHYLVARRPFGARPGAPRWLQAGMKIDF